MSMEIIFQKSRRPQAHLLVSFRCIENIVVDLVKLTKIIME